MEPGVEIAGTPIILSIGDLAVSRKQEALAREILACTHMSIAKDGTVALRPVSVTTEEALATLCDEAGYHYLSSVGRDRFNRATLALAYKEA